MTVPERKNATPRRSIAFVISSLGCGGAERVAAVTAAGMAERGHQVSVITYSDTSTDFYNLPPTVRRSALRIEPKATSFVGKLKKHLLRIRYLRRALLMENPDVVISFMSITNVITRFAAVGKRCSIIATEHCDPRMAPMGAIWRLLRRITYPYMTRLISVSQGVDRQFAWLPQNRRRVIYNPLFFSSQIIEETRALTFPYRHTIIAIGRLTPQKGFDILIRAFALIATHFPDWSLRIFGEGELHDQLVELSTSLGGNERVHLAGVTSSPISALKGADIFVLSSRYEGFGNVIIEAMGCSVPVVSTDCPSGPSEIIQNEINGVLVPPDSPERLAEAITSLIVDEEKRKRLGRAGLQTSHRFSSTKILDDWENLLTTLD